MKDEILSGTERCVGLSTRYRTSPTRAAAMSAAMTSDRVDDQNALVCAVVCGSCGRRGALYVARATPGSPATEAATLTCYPAGAVERYDTRYSRPNRCPSAVKSAPIWVGEASA